MKRVYATAAERRVAINKRRRAAWANDPAYRARRLGQHRAWWKKNKHLWHDYNNKYNAEYRKKNAKRLAAEKRAYHLRVLYGLTAADLRALKAKQKWRCRICKKRRPLRVDHCHTHGHVRGLLCDRCNVGLGCFKDDPRLLRAATIYVRGA